MGIINIVRKHTVNLTSTKFGLTEELFYLSEKSLEVIKSIINKILFEAIKANEKRKSDNNFFGELLKVIIQIYTACIG